MKKKDIVTLIIVLILGGVFIIREYQSSEIKEKLKGLETEVAEREQIAEKEKELYIKENLKAGEEIKVLHQHIEKIKSNGEVIQKCFVNLKKDLKKAKELKKATRSELYREIRKYRLTLKSAEESILNLTLENQELRKENSLWQERFKTAEKEIVRLEREYAVLKGNFEKAIKLGKKGRGSFAGKLVLFAAGVITASLVK